MFEKVARPFGRQEECKGSQVLGGQPLDYIGADAVRGNSR